MSTKFFNNFTGGEWTPLLEYRHDLERYGSACKTLENFRVLPYGGIRFRAGFEFVADLGSTPCRAIPFYRGDDGKFVLVFSELSLRIFGLGADGKWTQLKLTEDGGPLASPYTAEQIFAIHHKQLNDVIFLTHPDVPPHELRHEEDGTWTLAEILWDFPAIREENITSVKLTLNEATEATEAVEETPESPAVPAMPAMPATMTATDRDSDAEVFHKRHAGSYWVLNFLEPSSSLAFELYSTNYYKVKEYHLRLSKTGLVLDYGFGFIPGATIVGSFKKPRRKEWEKITEEEYHKWEEWNKKTPAERLGRAKKELKYENNANVPKGTVLTSNEFRVVGSWTLVTSNFWRGKLQLMRRYEDMPEDEWEMIREYESNGDRNVSDSGKQDIPALFRMSLVSSGPVWGKDVYKGKQPDSYHQAFAHLDIADSRSSVVVRVKEVLNPSSAVIEVVENLALSKVFGLATSDWSEGAWSDYRGFPSSLAFFEQRLFFGGNRDQPNTIWGSQMDDFINFRRGVNATDSITYTFSAANQNKISFLESMQKLIAVTTNAEFTTSSGRFEEPLSPTNVSVRTQSVNGGVALQPCVCENSILFVGKQGNRLLDFSYTPQTENFQAVEVGMLARHITEKGLGQLDRAMLPDNTVFSVMGNGEMMSMSYEPGQAVQSFTRWKSGGGGRFESVANVRGKQDDLFAIVRRAVPAKDPVPGKGPSVTLQAPITQTTPGTYIQYVCRMRFKTVKPGQSVTVRGKITYTDIIPIHAPTSSILTFGVDISWENYGVDGTYAPEPPQTEEGFDQTFEVEAEGEHFIDVMFHNCDNPNNYTNGATCTATFNCEFSPETSSEIRLEYLGLYADDEDSTRPPVGAAWPVREIKPGEGGGEGSADYTYSLERYTRESDAKDEGTWLDCAQTVDLGDRGVDIPAGRPFFVHGAPWRYFVNKDVKAVIDGRILNARVDNSGALVLPRPARSAKKLMIGFPYTGVLQTMPLDVFLQDGSSAGRKRRISRIIPKFYRTEGMKYGHSLENLTAVEFRVPGEGNKLDSTPPEFTGDKVNLWNGGHERDACVFVVQDQPMPFTLLGLSVFYEYTG